MAEQKIELGARLSFRDIGEGKKIASLTLHTKDPAVIETLRQMGFGTLEGVDGLQYCHVNTVYPYSIGGDDTDGYVLKMTVNFNYWTGEFAPSCRP